MFMRLFSLCPRRGREFSSRNVEKFLFNCPGVTRFAKNIKFFLSSKTLFRRSAPYKSLHPSHFKRFLADIRLKTVFLFENYPVTNTT